MARATGKVCVTGADGYLGSWVVKHLISNNYTVHDTVRQPGNAKYAHLNQLERAPHNLQLFKANVLDYDSLCSAIAGCIDVFHVASPVLSTIEEVIEPAVKGTLNVLKACVESNVKRVVVVSAVSLNTRWPVGQIKDEACRSDKEYCAATKNWYCLSKTEAEIDAFEFAKRSGLDVITVCPTLNGGHFCSPPSMLVASFSEGGEEDTISSEKLQRLGWSYRRLEETLVDSIESYKKAGILD
ncbi:hypothetical protein PVK06_016526 [Gossypium arboreum]|uniref:NAD-dependent epimerase/dehydratase domain-containing protein n=1 Tax=Gossypium arboreum TaxID=29729 RepID=A0ABR0Q0A6_GOSAR|nr:hypothetical protein PVK06_016526 [Gossypium arboreum]